MSRIFLRHGIVLTIDDCDAYYPDGCIVIEHEKLIFVGEDAQHPGIHPEDSVLDMRGKLIMPGLINTHVHSHSPLFRNFGEDVPLQVWLNDIMWPAESHMTEEHAYYAALHTCLESISSGVTTFADQFYFADAVARAVEKSGLRAFLCSSIFENGKSERGQTVQTAADFVAAWKGRNPLITPGLGPHAPYSVSAEQWRSIVALSQTTHTLIHTHISETKTENRKSFAEKGESPTKWLESLGVFSCPTLAAHCIYLSDEDIAVFRNHNVHVSYNPVSNLKLVSGIMPYLKLKTAGVQISLGTDGAQSNNTLDLMQDLKLAVLIQKQKENDPAFFSVFDAVRLVTIEGAKALGLDSIIGTLEAGKQADLIALDIQQPHLQPLHTDSIQMLYTLLVYCASGKDVTDAMVQGTWLMKDREILTLDVHSVLHNTADISEQLRKKAGLTGD